jgi:hypothetical protein
MVRKKLVTLTLFLLSLCLYALALVGTPVPAHACLWVCTGGVCSGGRLLARNSCTGQISCVSICATQ